MPTAISTEASRPEDFVLEDGPSALFRPLGLTLVRASGKDAVAFLHGQLTNRIENLAGHVRTAGYCSPKGRLLAVLRAWRDGEDVLFLIPTSIAAGLLKRLRMYVLRSDVTFAETEAKLLLLAGESGTAFAQTLGFEDLPAAGDLLESNGMTLLGLQPATEVPGFAAGGARALLTGASDELLAAHPASAALWWASEAAAGVASVHPETREAFVPQHVNLELTEGVVFNKGCYPGQEVVSRVQHIGETNRRAAIGIAPSSAPVLPGTPVFSKGEEAGFVVTAVTNGRENFVFCSVTLKALLEGVSLEADCPALEPLELPYRYRNVLKD